MALGKISMRNILLFISKRNKYHLLYLRTLRPEQMRGFQSAVMRCVIGDKVRDS